MTKSPIEQLADVLIERKDLGKEYGKGSDEFMTRLRCAQKRGYLTKDELMMIRDEKSHRNTFVEKNSDEDVQRLTKAAFQANGELERMRLLVQLHGVSVPTASCILAWTYPDRWGVIDQRAWRSLYQAGVVSTHSKGTGLGPHQWHLYCDALDRLSNLTKLKPQRIDKMLYGMDKQLSVRAASNWGCSG